MAYQKGTKNSWPILEDDGAPGTAVTDVTGDGGDLICEMLSNVATMRGFYSHTATADKVDLRSGGSVGDGYQFLVMDQSKWSTANSGAAITAANNFHFYNDGATLCRIEFESQGETQLYIEGGSGKDAWFGCQEGATTHWAFGSDASDSGALVFSDGHGLDTGTKIFKIIKAGGVEVLVGPFSVTSTAAANALVNVTSEQTSAATGGGAVRLRCDDGAAMDSGHRVGYVVFGGAEDASSTFHYCATIDCMTSEAWSASQNGAELVFNVTTNGATARSEAGRFTNDRRLALQGPINMQTSAAADPTTTEYPNDGDWGIHENTSSGNIYLAFNNGGAIVKVQLS